MSIDSLAIEYGLFTPQDLKFVTGIYDEVKGSQKTFEPWQHNALARQILYIFQSGERDREVLLTTVRGDLRKPRLIRFKRQRL